MTEEELVALAEPTDEMVAAALEAMAAPPDADDFKRGWRAAIAYWMSAAT